MSFISKVEAVRPSIDHDILKEVGNIAFDLYQRLRVKWVDEKHASKLKEVVDNLAMLPEILTGVPDTSPTIKKLQELIR
jgi:hypothetical protein